MTWTTGADGTVAQVCSLSPRASVSSARRRALERFILLVLQVEIIYEQNISYIMHSWMPIRSPRLLPIYSHSLPLPG